jgi:alkylation response protein AidB-like acyl-CoA dehydrogenase
MFDLTLSSTQEALIPLVRAHTDELRELAATSELDRKPCQEIVDRILDGQYALPAEDGVADPLSAVLAAQEYGYADPGIAMVIAGAWQARLLAGGAAAGTPAQLTSPLLFEGFGRGPSEYRTTATRTTAGWTITGRKEAVLHPGVAARSLVVARDDDGQLGVFLVEGVPTGYIVDRDDADEGKLGLRAAHTGAVRLDHVTVPDDARLDAGEPLALHRAVALARLLPAAIALGSARASVDYASGWATKRTAFGKVIASYQGVAFVLADLSTAIEAARLLLWDTVTALPRLADIESVEEAVARSVARATAVATDAGRQGVNLLGVHGIVTDHPVERWYRAAAALSTFDFDPLSTALELA